MMRRSAAIACGVVLLAGVLAMAQGPGKAPAPGPEHKRLAFWVGKWSGTGDMKPSPWGPGGKMTWNETCEWFAGNFAVVCRTEMKSPMGDGKSMSILAYHMEDKNYAYFGVTSIGEVEMSRGTVQGKLWNWTGEGKMQGKPYKIRYTINETSPNSATFKFEMSQDAGKTWAVVMEGTNNRGK
jgi:hypothetical protein